MVTKMNAMLCERRLEVWDFDRKLVNPEACFTHSFTITENVLEAFRSQTVSELMGGLHEQKCLASVLPVVPMQRLIHQFSPPFTLSVMTSNAN